MWNAFYVDFCLVVKENVFHMFPFNLQFELDDWKIECYESYKIWIGKTIKGFENALIVDSYSGGKGNSVRYMSVAKRDNYMRAKGIAILSIKKFSISFVNWLKLSTNGECPQFSIFTTFALSPKSSISSFVICSTTT